MKNKLVVAIQKQSSMEQISNILIKLHSSASLILLLLFSYKTQDFFFFGGGGASRDC